MARAGRSRRGAHGLRFLPTEPDRKEADYPGMRQNWQSEFLAIGSMVVLSIWLRETNSPESKEVQTPHWENEE